MTGSEDSSRKRPRGLTGVVHVHSNYSHDGRDSVSDLRRFAIAHGLAFVALTDHAEDLDSHRYAALQDECARYSDGSVTVLPGLEFRFPGQKGLHILAMGLRQWIAPHTFDELFNLSAGAVGLTVAAHPMLYRWNLPEPVAARVDAIEVWNAAYNTRYLPDPRAMRLLDRVRERRPEVIGVAGLDQHDARNYRGVRVVLHAASTTDPLAEIRAARFENVGHHLTFDSRASMSTVARLALRSTRAVLDSVNAGHEWLMHALRAHRG